MTWNEGEFDDLGAELRRRVGAEFAEEAAELERLTALQRKRRSLLADAAREAMHRGDLTSFLTRHGSWTGQLVSVGDDYAVLECQAVTVEAHLPSITLLTEPSRSGGRSGYPPSSTWRARLIELELNREEVSIFAGTREERGTVAVVAADYLEFNNEEGRWIVPIAAVAVVVRTRS